LQHRFNGVIGDSDNLYPDLEDAGKNKTFLVEKQVNQIIGRHWENFGCLDEHAVRGELVDSRRG
jgi:hypothetical protein